MRDLYESNGLTLITQERTDIPVSLEAWMELTNPAETIRKNIRELMNKDIAGCYQTGFSPYWKEDVIYFNQHWIFNMGIKQ